MLQVLCRWTMAQVFWIWSRMLIQYHLQRVVAVVVVGDEPGAWPKDPKAEPPTRARWVLLLQVINAGL